MFSDTTEHQEMNNPYETSYKVIEDCSHDDYVSQFLGPFPQIQENGPVDKISDESSHQKSQEIQNYSDLESESQYRSDQAPKAKRSPLHNFQKHFVTTIRRNVNIRWLPDDESVSKLAKEMWEIFQNSKKYTKEFVSLILGNIDHTSKPEILKKYGLQNCVKKYSATQFQAAQALLKSKVLGSFREASKDQIFYDRRIGKREQFAHYFFKVLSEIEEGSMSKRLPKKKKNARISIKN